MFKLSVNKKIRKQILRLPVTIQDRIEYELLEIIKLDHPILHRDVRKLRGYIIRYRLHIGLHNVVVFDIVKTENLIRVIEINTRENIRY